MVQKRARTALWGIGALGALVAHAAARDERIELVGAIDNAPDKVGRTLSQVTKDDAAPAVPIVPDIASRELADARPEIVVHMTESRVERIGPQLEEALNRGYNVLSAAETMFYPAFRYPQFAEHIHQVAQDNGVSVGGIGINPGFIFDRIVLEAALVSGEISSVLLDRVVDVSDTGPGDIEHVGFGLPVSEFEARVTDGTINGHIGLPESFALVGERLGLRFGRIEESWSPVTSNKAVHSSLGPILPGHVTGIVQRAEAYDDERIVMSARLAMYFTEALVEEPRDLIQIKGSHNVTLSFTPACVSILGVAHAITNAVPVIAGAPPGLLNLVDLPLAATPRVPGHHLTFDSHRSSPGTVVFDMLPRGV